MNVLLVVLGILIDIPEAFFSFYKSIYKRGWFLYVLFFCHKGYRDLALSAFSGYACYLQDLWTVNVA